MIKTLTDTISALGSDIENIIFDELRSQGIPQIPVLKIQLIQPPFSEHLLLDQSDILKLCSFYGEVLNVCTKSQEATIHFKSIISAYFAQKTLNNKFIESLNLTLSVSWNRTLPITKIVSKTETLVNLLDNNYKYTCKYEIEIRNCPEFQVSRRIIGPKGRNMKKIIEECVSDLPEYERDVVKLRLRGLGSGYKEAPLGVESEEPLHLCVSSKYYDKFIMACKETERLILTIYSEYDSFLKRKGMMAANFTVKTMN